MAEIVIAGNTSGSVTLVAPSIAGTTTLTLPASSGTVLDDASVGVCRAWVNFNGAGTVAIRTSFNVSSITDNGTGDYTVNFTMAMVDADYGFSTSTTTQIYSGGTASFESGQHPTVAPTVSAFRIATQRGDNSAGLDINYISVAIFR